MCIVLLFSVFFFFLMIRRPPRSTLFPYNDALPIFHSWTSCAAIRYPSLGVIVISCPGRYVAQILSRSSFGSMYQCVRQPRIAGGTCALQPGQWQGVGAGLLLREDAMGFRGCSG